MKKFIFSVKFEIEAFNEELARECLEKILEKSVVKEENYYLDPESVELN